MSFNKPFELLLPLRRLTDELDALTRSFSTVSRKLVKVRFSFLARARAYANSSGSIRIVMACFMFCAFPKKRIAGLVSKQYGGRVYFSRLTEQIGELCNALYPPS